jgi:hypothetical protein
MKGRFIILSKVIFICDIPLCYDNIIYKICISQNTPIFKTTDFMCLKEQHVLTYILVHVIFKLSQFEKPILRKIMYKY